MIKSSETRDDGSYVGKSLALLIGRIPTQHVKSIEGRFLSELQKAHLISEFVAVV